MSSVLMWTRTPTKLGTDVKSWGARVLDALFDLAVYWAARFEAYAREHAPWTDRTAHARKGLTAQAVRRGAIVFIYLFHTVAYGIWLEVAHLKKYAILLPTVMAHLADVIASLNRLVR